MSLVASEGLLSVTMSRIAEETGIGRATLYKYFPDVESIIRAWHQRQISHHIDHLAEVRDREESPGERLGAVLGAYAQISRKSRAHGDHELAAVLHRDEHVAIAERHLKEMVRNLIAEGVRAGDLRDDVSPAELAAYCLHALTAASGCRSEAAVKRLVDVTLAGLRPV